jgi:uncharacterized membrane protein YkoI
VRINRRLAIVAGAVAIAALAAGSVGIAQAVSGDEEQVTGAEAEQAERAALAATRGESVLEVERQDGDGRGVYEVEVRLADGSQVEIQLDGSYRPVGTVTDDDSGSGDDDADEGAGDD